MHGKCEARERFERVSKTVLALKMASLNYEQAQKCCRAAQLSLIDVHAEETAKEKDDINAFLRQRNSKRTFCAYPLSAIGRASPVIKFYWN